MITMYYNLKFHAFVIRKTEFSMTIDRIMTSLI